MSKVEQVSNDIQSVEQGVKEVQQLVAEAEPVIADVEKEAQVVAPIGQRLLQDLENAVEFVIHCFHCKNAKGTKTPLVKDSIALVKPEGANATQVSGVCAKCRCNVKGFVTNTVAAQYQTSTGSTIPAPSQQAPSQPAAKEAKN